MQKIDFTNCKRIIGKAYNGANGKKIAERPELAIIDKETFEKAQKIILQNRQKFKADGERKSCKPIFSTLIKCGDCGHYFRQNKRKIKFGYKYTWVCCGRNINGTDFCANKTG